MATELIVVGRLGRAHGIKGEVSVEPRTDEPERRFAVGSALGGRAPGGEAFSRTLTVAGTRWHQGRLLVRFAELTDRTTAEEARGLELVIPLDLSEKPADPEEFYDHQLVGLAASLTSGAALGPITSVIHGSAQDLLAIDVEGREVLVPFVAALVPTVDLEGGRVVIADLPGLIEPLES